MVTGCDAAERDHRHVGLRGCAVVPAQMRVLAVTRRERVPGYRDQQQIAGADVDHVPVGMHVVDHVVVPIVLAIERAIQRLGDALLREGALPCRLQRRCRGTRGLPGVDVGDAAVRHHDERVREAGVAQHRPDVDGRMRRRVEAVVRRHDDRPLAPPGTGEHVVDERRELTVGRAPRRLRFAGMRAGSVAHPIDVGEVHEDECGPVLEQPSRTGERRRVGRIAGRGVAPRRRRILGTPDVVGHGVPGRRRREHELELRLSHCERRPQRRIVRRRDREDRLGEKIRRRTELPRRIRRARPEDVAGDAVHLRIDAGRERRVVHVGARRHRGAAVRAGTPGALAPCARQLRHVTGHVARVEAVDDDERDRCRHTRIPRARGRIAPRAPRARERDGDGDEETGGAVRTAHRILARAAVRSVAADCRRTPAVARRRAGRSPAR